MRLPDGPRHLLAGGLASGAFLALFFGLALTWWLALLLGAAIYGAALLLVQRRTALEEIKLSSRGVTAADIAAAGAALDDAARRLAQAARQAPDQDRTALADMAETVGLIRQAILEDPEDYRAARSFVTVHLPNIVQTVESYVKLSSEARGDVIQRLADLSDRIRGFGPVVERIHRATVENNLRALEIEVSVLSDQLDRRG